MSWFKSTSVLTYTYLLEVLARGIDIKALLVLASLKVTLLIVITEPINRSVWVVILYRTIVAYGSSSTVDGICFADGLIFKQYYDGSSYGKLIYVGFKGRDTLDCE